MEMECGGEGETVDESCHNFNRVAARSVADGRLRFPAGGLEFTVLSCQYNELPAGLRVPEHEHPYYCLTVVERSSMRTGCDGRTVENAAGKPTLFFLPPAVSHDCRFGEGELHLNWSVNFQIGGAHAMEINERIARRAAELGYEIPLSGEEALLLREIRLQGEPEVPLVPELLSHLLAAFLVMVIRRNFSELLENASEREVLRAGFRRDRIDAMRRAMWAMVRDPDPVRRLAECFELSPRHLNRIFRQGTGKSIKEYQNELRIASACDLLRNSTLPVSLVAEAVGFHRPGLFAAFFRKHLNCTPQEYRIRPEAAGVPSAALPEVPGPA